MKILHYPNPSLRVQCKPITKITPKVKRDSQRLFHALHSIDKRLFLINALAANQIGIFSRIVAFKFLNGNYEIMLNPEITSSFLPFFSLEICASLPKIVRVKKRYLVVKVRYKSISGKQITKTLGGFTAFTMQQEIDHLNGKLIID